MLSTRQVRLEEWQQVSEKVSKLGLQLNTLILLTVTDNLSSECDKGTQVTTLTQGNINE